MDYVSRCAEVPDSIPGPAIYVRLVLTDRPDMTLVVYRGRKTTTTTTVNVARRGMYVAYRVLPVIFFSLKRLRFSDTREVKLGINRLLYDGTGTLSL